MYATSTCPAVMPIACSFYPPEAIIHHFRAYPGRVSDVSIFHTRPDVMRHVKMATPLKEGRRHRDLYTNQNVTGLDSRTRLQVDGSKTKLKVYGYRRAKFCARGDAIIVAYS